jgi:hypothetical protein
MRKIHPKYEDIVDNELIKLSEYLSPYFKELNLSANDITTLSFIFGLISLYLLYHGYYDYFPFVYLISYFFDVMDGYYARKYKITSKFGDLYDHIKDNIMGIALFIIAVCDIDKKNSDYLKYYLSIAFFFFILMNYYIGCQENIYNKNNDKNSVLDLHKVLCKKNPKKQIKILKYFGTGVFVSIISFLIYSIKHIPIKYK